MRPEMERNRFWRWDVPVLALLLLSTPPSPAGGQDTVAVMVDESATATRLLERLREQRLDNPGEAARLADRLLREFPDRLVPTSDGDPDLFRAAGREVESELRGDPDLAAAFVDLSAFRARRHLESGDLEIVTKTALWTPAGLEAALRLAQRDAEAGLGHRSLRRLDRLDGHPGLADADAASRRDQLRRLARWVAEGDGPESLGAWPPEVRSDSPFEPQGSAPSAGTWSELWREPLPDSPFERAFRESRRSGRPVPRTADRIVADGSLLIVMPAADDERIYVNEGHVVRAIDRLSRRERWRTPIDGADGQGLGAIGDPTLVVVRGDRVVTVEGHALGNRRTGSGRIVCLDRDTGSIRWATDLAEFPSAGLGDAGGDAVFPYGVVVLGSDAVHVMARRVTNRLETIDYLAALDLEDGRVRWLVPLGSCGGVRLGGTRPYAAPVVAGGRVLVNASVGVVAGVDAADGSIDWLRREMVPLREGRYSTEPWEISQPLPIGDRVFSLAPDQSAILELDAETGVRRARHDGAAIAAAQPRYLLGAQLRGRPVVLAVGSDVVAYDAEDLRTPLWSYATRNRPVLAEDPGVANRNGIRGRVQVVGDALLVPGGEALRVVDLESGRIRRTLDWSEGANVLSTDGQLVFADKDSIVSVMDPEVARTRLAERRLAAPDDPEWPMAVMDLELACGHRDDAIEAAEQALDAVERTADREERGRLFERLIEFDVSVRRDRERGRRVRDLLAAAAVEPEQRVRERLSRGDWHADRGEFPAAIEVWQSLLADSGLGRLPVREQDRFTTARVAARERMRDLAALEGESLLAPAAALAELRLERLLASAPDSESLLALAREFPLSEAAGRARLAAASRLETSGRPFDAMLARIAEIRAGVETESDDAAWRHDVVAEIERAGGTALARRLEQTLGAAGPSAPRLGRIPQTASEFAGRLVDVAPGVAADLGNAVLLADEHSMRSLRLDGGAPAIAWTVPVEDPSPSIVGGGPTLLVWQNADRRRPIAMAVDASTGEVAWLNPSVAALFPALRTEREEVDGGARAAAGSAGVWREARDEILPGVVEDRLVLVRRDGTLVGLDAADGTTVHWTLEGVMDRVQSVEPGPLGLLLAGEAIDEAGIVAPVVVLVSRDGRIERRWDLDATLDREIRWIRQTAHGEVAWGTSNGVSWRGLMPGDGDEDERWSLQQPQVRDSLEAWLRPGRLIVRERSDRIVNRRSRDGVPMAGVTGSDLPDAARFEQMLIARDGRSAAIYGDRVLVLDRHGEPLGIDAVHEDRNYLLGGLAEDGVVVLSFEGAGPTMGADGTPRTEFTYAIYRFGLDDGGRQLGPALELRTLGPRFESMWIRDGWVLLSSPVSTVAIPMR